MSLLSRLRTIFNPPPEVPAHQEGVYRGGKVASKPERLEDGSLKPVSPTLFARPAPVPVVAPTTEADHYRWLDEGDLPVSAMVATPELPPHEEPQPFDGGRTFNPSGCFIQHTHHLRENLCITGMITTPVRYGYVFATGRL